MRQETATYVDDQAKIFVAFHIETESDVEYCNKRFGYSHEHKVGRAIVGARYDGSDEREYLILPEEMYDAYFTPWVMLSSDVKYQRL